MNTTANRNYLRKSVINKVIETHNTITTRYNGFFEKLQINPTNATLFDTLAIPGCGTNIENLDCDLLRKIKKMLLDGVNGKAPTPNDFRNLSSAKNDYAYTLIQNNMMINTYKFIQILKTAGFLSVLNNPNPKWQQIEKIGLHTISASTALAIKEFWIFKFDEKYEFHGNAAFTNPVKKFYKQIFGSSNFTQGKINQITFETANEIGKDPLWVNSAQWCIGYYFLK